MTWHRRWRRARLVVPVVVLLFVSMLSGRPVAYGQTPAATSTPTAAATATPTTAGATATPPAATATPPPPAATSTATATVAPTETPTATATITPTVTPTPTATIPPAPPAPHDGRFFFETSFRVDNDAFWNYFNARGSLESFGFPISRQVQFLGCTTQFFQRQLMQRCGDGPVQIMNLLDPDLLPITRVNQATFPGHDGGVASAAPPPGTPDYGVAVLNHVQATAPEVFDGLPVGFFTLFLNTVQDDSGDPDFAAAVNLEIWGFPTSRPNRDPNNGNFVYQRFQRGIMHYDNVNRVTHGILLADWFKVVIIGQTLPADLAEQVAGSRFFRQYCPGNPGWLCRPADVPGTDLTFAFERQ